MLLHNRHLEHRALAEPGRVPLAEPASRRSHSIFWPGWTGWHGCRRHHTETQSEMVPKQGRSRRELDAASKTNETQTRISVPRRDDGDDTPIISNHSPSNQQMHSIANGRCFCERRSCGCCRRRGEVASSNNVATPLRFIATSLRIIAASLHGSVFAAYR